MTLQPSEVCATAHAIRKKEPKASGRLSCAFRSKLGLYDRHVLIKTTPLEK